MATDPKAYIKQMLGALAQNPREQFWRRGIDFNRDITVTCPRSQICTIFDVGAYLGEETEKFLKAWSGARIYAFEPSPQSFERLASRMRKKRVTTVNAALSSAKGASSFVLLGVTEMGSSNHLWGESDQSERSASKRIISVRKTTIDEFCLQNAIEHIDILKVDTEGHELEVLSGAQHLLTHHAVGYLRLECGVDPDNSRHSNIGQCISYLLAYDYKVFGFYEQENEFFKQEPQLRRADVAFISPLEIKRNHGHARRWPSTLLDWAVNAKRKATRA